MNARCPSCARNTLDPLTQRGRFKIYRCVSCGHGCVLPAPAQEDLSPVYLTDSAVDEQLAFPESSIRKHAARLFRWIHQFRNPPGALLDFGCGRGVHLEAALRAGWTAIGLDLSPTAQLLCSKKGLRIYKDLGSLEQDFSPASFEAITLWETLEHQPDPSGLLCRLRRLLKGNGVLALSTPNFSSVLARRNYAGWQELRPPLHVHFFTPGSLRHILESSGFFVLNQLTYASFDERIDRLVDRAVRAFRLPSRMGALPKSACYKFSKPYFDRKLQDRLLGLGLLCLASPTKWNPPQPVRKYFYF